MNNEIDRIPPGLWAPIPIPAIKLLVRNKQRPASRILYAIVLHKGKAKSAIFPGYPTLALYANVGENNIRKCLDVLEAYGFIKITKTRQGKKNRNVYEILDKAYNLEINPKSETKKGYDTMICNSCWEDVESSNILIYKYDTWESRNNEDLVHKICFEKGESGRLIPITELSRGNQSFQRMIIENQRRFTSGDSEL